MEKVILYKIECSKCGYKGINIGTRVCNSCGYARTKSEGSHVSIEEALQEIIKEIAYHRQAER